MRCENCPAGWEDRSYEGECNDCGCLIYGHGLFDDDCKLSNATIRKRLKQLEDYHNGKIDRPQWIVNKFMRELDATCYINGEPGYSLYPPKRMSRGVYYPLYGPNTMYYERSGAYRDVYEDAKSGRECDPHRHYGRNDENKVIFE